MIPIVFKVEKHILKSVITDDNKILYIMDLIGKGMNGEEIRIQNVKSCNKFSLDHFQLDKSYTLRIE